MNQIAYQTALSKYKLSTLKQICLLCGIPTQASKSERIGTILNYLSLVHRLKCLKDLNILSIDIGIKNFSYCKVNNVDLLNTKQKSNVYEWNKINLHEKYGKGYQPLTNSLDSMIDSKRYLSFLNFHLVEDLILKSSSKPDVVIIESQRTRSNNNSITLPNVLLNYTFENMLYSNFYTLSKVKQDCFSKCCLILPMNANSMVSFWINRFIKKDSLSNNSKKLRMNLFFNWLADQHISPFKLTNLRLPADFKQHSVKQKSLVLLKYLKKKENDKIDDLIDSLLYNLTIKFQLSNLLNLLNHLNNNNDLNELVYELNLIQLNLIKELIIEFDLELNDEFQYYNEFIMRKLERSI